MRKVKDDKADTPDVPKNLDEGDIAVMKTYGVGTSRNTTPFASACNSAHIVPQPIDPPYQYTLLTCARCLRW